MSYLHSENDLIFRVNRTNFQPTSAKTLRQSTSLSFGMENENTAVKNRCQLANSSRIECIQNHSSFKNKLQFNQSPTDSGTSLIRSPTGHKNMAVLMGCSY